MLVLIKQIMTGNLRARTGELQRTDFDFLHGKLAFYGDFWSASFFFLAIWWAGYFFPS